MQRVGRHSIGREIANSGLLATYEATHEDGRAVRLRVFDAGFRAEPSAVDRFEHDCSNAATVRHPSVDRPIAWSATYPVHVSTTLARSATLTEIYERAPSGRLDPGVVAGIGADVAEALNAVHAAGLVHAGLSPESVLLGTDGRAHVTDFGLMRFLNDMSATHSQVMRGSIESLTPEQLSAPDTVGPHTDVFGLGLLLYRTLTGKPAFDAPSALGMSIRISMGKVTPIDTHGIEMPAELSELVMKMLAAAPMNRPPIDHVVSVLTELAQKSGPWRDAVRTLAAEATPEAEAAPSVTPAGAEPPSTGALPEEEPAPFANPPQEAPRAPAETMETPQISFSGPPPGAVAPPRAAAPPFETGPSTLSPSFPPGGAFGPPPGAERPPAHGNPSGSFGLPPTPMPSFPSGPPHQPSGQYGTAAPRYSDFAGESDFDNLETALHEPETEPELSVPERRNRDRHATLLDASFDAAPTESLDISGTFSRSDLDDAPMWPAADYEGQEVPKTVVIQAPSAAPERPRCPAPRSRFRSRTCRCRIRASPSRSSNRRRRAPRRP